MGVFESFWAWLNAQLSVYIGSNTARVAAAIEPAVVILASLYVMAWGYLLLMGRIDEPLAAGLKRIVALALVMGVALRLWLYNSVIVDTFYQAPAQLAAAIVGSSDPVQTIDTIWDRGGTVAGQLWAYGSVLHGDFGFYLAGAVVWLLIGLLCVYSMFLIALANIALAVLLALGPLFITCLLFDGTRRLFLSWAAQLVNYALITVMTVLIAGLLLRVVESYATQTAARGSAVVTVDALNMVLVSALVFLVMRQVMPIAAGLAGGVALNTYNVTSRALRYGRGISGGVARSTGGYLAAKWRSARIADDQPDAAALVDRSGE